MAQTKIDGSMVEGLPVEATQTEMNTGTDTGTSGEKLFASPSKVLGLTSESDELTLTVGGLVSFAHGLGVKPRKVSARMRCVVDSNGWAVGDEVYIGFNNSNSTNNRQYGVYADTSNVYFRCSDSAQTFIVSHKTTGAVVATDNNAWRLILVAEV